MKLKNWLEVWLNKYTKHTVKLRTYGRYEYIIEKHINPKLGDYELEELSPVLLQDFVLDKIEHGNLKTNGQLANNSVIGIVNVLKSALGLAKSLEMIERDYTDKIKLPLATEKEVTAFDKLEQDKLVKFCLEAKKKNYIGIVICLYTGIRLGELLALTWNDIDLNSGIMNITKTAYRIKENGTPRIVVDKPKTKNSSRIIPLPKQLIEILKQVKKKSNSLYVLSTRNGGMVGTREYQKTYQRILAKLDIPYKNFHSLRHTFATRAVEMGMDVKTLSEILGHKNPMITLQRYTHSLISYKTEMMNKMGKMLVIKTLNQNYQKQ